MLFTPLVLLEVIPAARSIVSMFPAAMLVLPPAAENVRLPISKSWPSVVLAAVPTVTAVPTPGIKPGVGLVVQLPEAFQEAPLNGPLHEAVPPTTAAVL